jgi:hypothetical protein
VEAVRRQIAAELEEFARGFAGVTPAVQESLYTFTAPAEVTELLTD